MVEAHREAAAKAIWEQGQTTALYPQHWDDAAEFQRDNARAMAAAAFQAIGLREETGCFVIPPQGRGRLRIEQVSHNDRVVELAEKYPERFELASRLVSEWVGEQQ